ncbi:MAG: aminoacyl-tRNA hydrolase [Patescibacteria group bacterium]
MILIVGLGNPGSEYKNTRHNIGARIVSELKSLNLKGVILAEPTTFMNESGKAVKSLLRSLASKREAKLLSNNLIVIHDDLDIPLGEFKIQKNRGSAGHKGVQSIIDALGAKDFNRIRIGICPENGKPADIEKFVLQNFTKTEEKTLKQTIPTIINSVVGLANHK